ncbi:arf-GAP with GTPase, ANK repeat and PH domain-containing protein 3-like [Dromaius novaehollandiae]|uniref:arf-GAP with GTPase, ANK repeat and PH domain-containing protein 3-like n=1 Tax=Dromaius novaehollandiae TaxID=8790 RepID=UPI00311DE350
MNFQGGPGQSPQQQSLAAPGGPVPVPGPSGPQPGGPPPPQFGLSNSAAIRAEIGRFESVHPNIYAIYDLIERVEDLALQSQIREHVISIEGGKESSRSTSSQHQDPQSFVCVMASWRSRLGLA